MHAYRLNHYEQLGLARNADADAIRVAYRALAKQVHPDLSDGESKDAFLRLQEAYAVLRDPLQRARYDRELDQRAAMAEAARAAARRPVGAQASAKASSSKAPKSAPKTAPRGTAYASTRKGTVLQSSRRRRGSRLVGVATYLGAVLLVVLVTGGIMAWQRFFPPEPRPVTVARVDPPTRLDRAGPGPLPSPDHPAIPPAVPPPVGSSAAVPPAPLAPTPLPPASSAPSAAASIREADRAVQAQIERVEAAKKRLEAQLSELEARKSAPAAPPRPPAAGLQVAHVQCVIQGTSIVLTREGDTTRVSFDNGPEVQPRISEISPGTVLVSQVEPSSRIAIAFTRGNPNGTTILVFDETGKVQQTVAIPCSAAAF